MGIILWILLAMIAFCIGGLLGIYYSRKFLTEKIREELKKEFYEANQSAEEIKKEAKREAEDIVKNARLDAKEEAHKIKEEALAEKNRQRDELKKTESKLDKRDEALSLREEQLIKREDQVRNKENAINEKENEIVQLVNAQKEELLRIAGMTEDEAKEIVFENTRRRYEHEIAQMFKEIKDTYADDADRQAKWVVSTAIQRHASEFVNELAVNAVPLPSDDMKGRIIGREGRNIRAFEKITGTDLIIDDTPEVVVISCFNPLRREIARLTLEKLIVDGRIHPANIEEMYDKARNEIIKQIKDEGQNALFETGIKGLHGELTKLIGRLKFRTSFGQNVLEHAIEVSKLAALMASELGLNVERAKRGALLHDIGKAVDHEVDGSHAMIGSELAKRYGEKEDIINMIQYHHNETEATCPESVIVAAADALSAARPGARRETVDLYIKRLEKLESIANDYGNVEKAFAIQAGRELRIIVMPEKVDDAIADQMAFEIAKKIEEEVQYPGQLKVTVIREKRSVAYAN
ncbi:MAG TPA: ribonuclease Y [Thermotogota bacterium]|nr:ribonuclease Y [Thermotogota bacterium]